MADMNSVVGKVFAYIADHKDVNPKDIAKSMKSVNLNTISASCSELYKAGFVTRSMVTLPNGRASFAYRAAKTMTDAADAASLTPHKESGAAKGGPRKRKVTALNVLVTIPIGRTESATVSMEEFISLYQRMRQLAKSFGVRDE